jgi:hypothetical protein
LSRRPRPRLRAEVRREEVRPAEVRLSEARPVEVSPGEHRPREVCPAEVRLEEVRPEVRLEEVHLGEVCLSEVRPAEVGSDVSVLVTPCVLGIHPLRQLSDVIVIRHASKLLNQEGSSNGVRIVRPRLEILR